MNIKKNISVDLEKEYAEIQKEKHPVREIWATASLADMGDYRQTVFSLLDTKLGMDFNLKEFALENKKQMPGALITEFGKKGGILEIFPYPHEFKFPPLV